MSLKNNYTAIIAQIKAEIETARLKAAISVNQLANVVLENWLYYIRAAKCRGLGN
jgi:hypothetical protein